MKAFKPVQGVKFEWDVRSIADGLYNIGCGTIFKNIEKASLSLFPNNDILITIFRSVLATICFASPLAPSRSSSTGTRIIPTRYETHNSFRIKY